MCARGAWRAAIRCLCASRASAVAGGIFCARARARAWHGGAWRPRVAASGKNLRPRARPLSARDPRSAPGAVARERAGTNLRAAIRQPSLEQISGPRPAPDAEAGSDPDPRRSRHNAHPFRASCQSWEDSILSQTYMRGGERADTDTEDRHKHMAPGTYRWYCTTYITHPHARRALGAVREGRPSNLVLWAYPDDLP